MWVSGSNKFEAFEDYLIPRPVWERMRASGEPPVAVEPDPKKCLDERSARLHEELAKVSRLLGSGKPPGVRLENGEIKVSRLKKEEPEGMDAFRRKLYSFLPRIRLTDLLVEADSHTDFSRHFTHVRTITRAALRRSPHRAMRQDGVYPFTSLTPCLMRRLKAALSRAIAWWRSRCGSAYMRSSIDSTARNIVWFRCSTRSIWHEDPRAARPTSCHERPFAGLSGVLSW